MVLKNISDIVKYFENGCKNANQLNIGVEHEKFLFHRNSNKRINFSTVTKLFNYLTKFGWKPVKEGKKTISLFKNKQTISLEPGNQIELSGAKLNSLHLACDESYKFLNELKEKSKKTQIVLVRASPIMETLTGIMIASLIFYSGKLIISNELSINNFFSFLAAMMLAYQPVRSLATLNISINQSLSASKRVLPIIDHRNEIFEKDSDQELKVVQGDIDFKNVNFKYDTKEDSALNLINLKIKGGKMTSLVGYSGAGKSTILNLIPRYYDCNSGDILIDKQSIYKSKLSSLRKNISLVSQDVTLFDDTIKNNIAYADLNASEDEIKKVAKLSFADDFIQKLPDKYDALIGENGLRLSGGEKQRISIARAMLKKSKIILLDEATSSLDAETENKIQQALSILIKDRTAVVIAHRLSTILNSDSIYVINNGKVIENGTHSELLSNSEIYKSFYQKQIRKD